MMDMTENSKLDSASSYEGRGSEENISTQKISVSGHMKGFHYTTDDKSHSFVIDMESFSHGGANRQTSPNSRTTRSPPRKGSQQGDKKTITHNCTNSDSSSTINDRDSFVSTTSSPQGSVTLENPTAVAVGSIDHACSPQVHHQITITTGNITSATETRFSLRRNSFRRSPNPPWLFSCSLPHCRAWAQFC